MELKRILDGTRGKEGVNSLRQPLFWMLVGWSGLVINRVGKLLLFGS